MTTSFPSCLRVVVNRAFQRGTKSFVGALSAKDLVDQEEEELRRVVQEAMLVGSVVFTDAAMRLD